jgi:hypothetical protein
MAQRLNPASAGLERPEGPRNGIFSVVQKEAEHYSNLYDDAHAAHATPCER